MPRPLTFAALVAVIAALGGCATGYQSSGLTGGYSDAPGPGETRQVFFSGNGYIKSEKVETYLLYRCAELTKAAGHRHFTIYDSLGEALIDAPRERPDARVILNKPSGRVFLLFHPEPVPGAHDADEVLERLGPEVKG